MLVTIHKERLPLHDRGRTSGFVNAIVKAGTIRGDFIEIPIETWRKISRAHRPQTNRVKPRRGLGDLVATFAQPIARAIDRVAGTDLEHCGGCAQRKEALNRLGPKL